MTTVKLDPALANVPAVHALVIGVGDYPFLEGGSQQPPNKPTFELKQLTSAPHSALEFAMWLAKDLELPQIKNEVARPLGSIEIVISKADGAATFTDPAIAGAAPQKIDRADMATVKKAFSAWFDRANTHEDNIALFFFSGHGFSDDALPHGLVLDGFSGAEKNPFDQVIDIDRLVANMNNCLARRQCFLIDACRSRPKGLKLASGDPLLVPIFDPPTDVPREAAFLRSTSELQSAFGNANKPTRFTSALLRALRGAGCELKEDRWLVHTDDVITHLNDLLDYETRTKMLPVQRPNGLGDFYSKGFALSVPKQPMVPVFVRCDPPTDTPKAVLSFTHAQKVEKRGQKLPDEWIVEVAINGEYEFCAEFDDGTRRTKPIKAQPTLAEVLL